MNCDDLLEHPLPCAQSTEFPSSHIATYCDIKTKQTTDLMTSYALKFSYTFTSQPVTRLSASVIHLLGKFSFQTKIK